VRPVGVAADPKPEGHGCVCNRGLVEGTLLAEAPQVPPDGAAEKRGDVVRDPGDGGAGLGERAHGVVGEPVRQALVVRPDVPRGQGGLDGPPERHPPAVLPVPGEDDGEHTRTGGPHGPHELRVLGGGQSPKIGDDDVGPPGKPLELPAGPLHPLRGEEGPRRLQGLLGPAGQALGLLAAPEAVGVVDPLPLAVGRKGLHKPAQAPPGLPGAALGILERPVQVPPEAGLARLRGPREDHHGGHG
jgi:hypothetical protein